MSEIPWFKVDDKLHSHAKTAKAGEAMALWVVAGSWCMDHLTDGFIPDYIARRLMVNADEHAAVLVKCGLWTPAEDGDDKGWQFHDWDVHQPSREAVEDERRKARERMANRRRSAPEVRPNNAGTSDSVRLPRPDPTRPESSTNSGARKRPAHTLPDNWEPNDKHREYAAAHRLDVNREAFKFRNHATGSDRRQANWNAAFNTWLARAEEYAAPKRGDDRPSMWETATKIGDWT